MNTFNEREKAYEAKYLHDEELMFKIRAKQHHLFGAWAATILGYNEQKTEQYIPDVICAELQKSKGMTALTKVIADFKNAHIDFSEHRVQKEYEKCFNEAKKMFMKETEDRNG